MCSLNVLLPKQGWSSNSGSDLTKVIIIHDLSAPITTALSVWNPRRAGLWWDFHPSGHTRVRPPICSLSRPSVSSFPMQWHQGMMLPVLGLGLHPLGFSGWCIFLTITDFLQKTGISVARNKPQWRHRMKSLPSISGGCCRFQQSPKCFRDCANRTALPSH